MIAEHELTALPGTTVVGTDGQKIGKVVDVYESTDGSDEGTFVTVSTGLFGSHSSFLPLQEATHDGSQLRVPYDKDLVKNAPRVDVDEELSSEEEERLYAHYRLGGSGTPTSGTGTATAGGLAAGAAGAAAGTSGHRTGGSGTVGHDTSGPTTDDAMTRSEQRLEVGTQRVEAGRARLRKRIVTQTETHTVAVSHDELRVVREPVTGATAGAAFSGPELSEEEHEVVLRREEPVVTKETVPVERVRLATETVTGQETVSAEVQHEEIELEGDTRPGGRTPRGTSDGRNDRV